MTKKFNEGLADLADAAERDHEVQMARAELYKIAKYSIKLHEMLRNVSEADGLEGWIQSKITKAADYIGAVYHNLDYEMKFGGDGGETGPEMPMTAEGKKAKPDFADLDGDGNKKEPMKKAAKDAKKVDEYKMSLHAQLQEKAKSKAQQKFMGMVYATKKGEKPASKEVAKVAKGMSKKSAKDYAQTKHKGKPEHVKKD